MWPDPQEILMPILSLSLPWEISPDIANFAEYDLQVFMKE